MNGNNGNNRNNKMKTQYSDFFKKKFSKMITEMVYVFFNEEKPFVLYLQNNNNWDKPFPKNIQESPVLQITYEKEVFEKCVYNQIEETLTLKIQFGEEVFIKKLEEQDVIAIFDIEGNPIIYKPFKEEKLSINDYTCVYNKSKGIIRSLIDSDVKVLKKPKI